MGQPGAHGIFFENFLEDYFTPNQDFQKRCPCTGFNMIHIREYTYERMHPGTFINMQAMRFDARMLKLKSFCVHNGTYNSGHYFSFGRTRHGWMMFDDLRARAEPRTEAQILVDLRNVYFMIWEVMHSAPAPPVAVGNDLFHYREIHPPM